MTTTPQPLATDLTLGSVELSVGDLKRSVNFHQNVLGLRVLETGNGTARLGAGQRTLLILHERPGAPPAPRSTPGLYHFALLLPSRADLARWVKHAAAQGVRVGQADHLVSEAFYLTDPDGHGIEVYRDRPRDAWAWQGSEVQMASDPIDIQGLLSEPGADEPWTGAPNGTVMGHVHLRVTDVPATEAFYAGTLGFDVAARWPGALFVSVGGYHHHFGLNAWHSQGGASAPAGSAKLERVHVILPDANAVQTVAERLARAAHAFTREDDALNVRDPSGNLLGFTARPDLAS